MTGCDAKKVVGLLKKPDNFHAGSVNFETKLQCRRRPPCTVACHTSRVLVSTTSTQRDPRQRAELGSLRASLYPPLRSGLFAIMFYDVNSQAFASFLRTSGSSKCVGRLLIVDAWL